VDTSPTGDEHLPAGLLQFAASDGDLPDRQQISPVYVSPFRTRDGESILHLYQLETYDLMHFPHLADFYIRQDQIVCNLLDPDRHYMVEIHLLGNVLSYWVERQGIPVLHASAVLVDNGAVAFLANSRGGKSLMATTFLQAGYALLTDDILPVERRQERLYGRPSYPRLRLWPREAEFVLNNHRDLQPVHPEHPKYRVPVGFGEFGSFCNTAQPLTCLYLPERRDAAEWGTDVQVSQVSPRDAVIALVKYSFTPRIVEAIGLQHERLDLFAEMARRIPVRRIIYPSGFDYLSTVRDAIIADLRSLQH
jgi:hypothetical protein